MAAWLLLLLGFPALVAAAITALLVYLLGPALRSRVFWPATLACGLIVPLLLGLWAARLLVPDLLDPPTALPDGIPGGPMFLMFALVALPVSLATSYLLQRGSRES